MKKKILAIILVFIIPIIFFAGCKNEPNSKINMSRYFTSCSYILKNTNNSITGNVNSYFDNKHTAMNNYSSLTLVGDSNWLYGMTLDYITFEIYSSASGEFELQMKITNVTKGDNEEEQTPDKVFDKSFSWNVEANTAKLVKIDINDTIKSISAETKLTFIFSVTPNSTFTIEAIQLYGAHK